MEDFIKFVVEEIPAKKKRGRPRKATQEGTGWLGDQLKKVKKSAQGAVRTVGKTV